jgi:hypothetical protein
MTEHKKARAGAQKFVCTNSRPHWITRNNAEQLGYPIAWAEISEGKNELGKNNAHNRCRQIAADDAHKSMQGLEHKIWLVQSIVHEEYFEIARKIGGPNALSSKSEGLGRLLAKLQLAMQANRCKGWITKFDWHKAVSSTKHTVKYYPKNGGPNALSSKGKSLIDWWPFAADEARKTMQGLDHKIWFAQSIVHEEYFEIPPENRWLEVAGNAFNWKTSEGVGSNAVALLEIRYGRFSP